MKKIFYYLLLLVFLGGAIVSFWIYQRYLKVEIPKLLTFTVVVGDIQEVVKVRGEVVAQKDFNLEFPFVGIVERIFVQEGQMVSQNDPLVKLETTDFELEIRKLNSVIIQSQANLDKLITGPTQEDIRVFETKVENAKASLEDAQKNLIDKLQDAYTRADDAVRGKADQLFSSPGSANPKLNSVFVENQNSIEWERSLTESALKTLAGLLGWNFH